MIATLCGLLLLNFSDAPLQKVQRRDTMALSIGRSLEWPTTSIHDRPCINELTETDGIEPGVNQVKLMD